MRPLVLLAISSQLSEEVDMKDKLADIEKAQESLGKMGRSKDGLPEISGDHGAYSNSRKGGTGNAII